MYQCNGDIPVLESDRLLLRKMGTQDAEAMYLCWSHEAVRSYSGIPPMASKQSAYELIQLLNLLSQTEEGLRWGIVHKPSGAMIGSCGYNMWQLEGAARGEIGCELTYDYWGKGYMKEAMGLVLVYGFEVMSLNRIEGLIHPMNQQAQHLFDRLGFSNEGRLRSYRATMSGYTDVYMYSLLREEWIRDL